MNDILPLKEGNTDFYVESIDSYEFGVYDNEERLIDIFTSDDLEALAIDVVNNRYERTFKKVKR